MTGRARSSDGVCMRRLRVLAVSRLKASVVLVGPLGAVGRAAGSSVRRDLPASKLTRQARVSAYKIVHDAQRRIAESRVPVP